MRFTKPWTFGAVRACLAAVMPWPTAGLVGRYAHQGTTVYMLTQLPQGTRRKVGYDDSGWTTYERRSAEQIKKVYLYQAKWKLVLDLGSGAGESRGWPLDPNGFDELIESKQFTNGADKDSVKVLYRKMSEGQLGNIEMLDFEGIAEPTVKDMEQLGRCLSLCQHLKLCDLQSVGLTDETCAGLFSTLTQDAHIAELILASNQLGPMAAKDIAGYASGNASLTEVISPAPPAPLPRL